MEKEYKKYPRRFDIYIANLDGDKGSEQSGKRPVVIIQNNVGNKYSPTVIVACVSTKPKRDQLTQVEFKAGQYGFIEDSVVMLEQMRTIDKFRLWNKVGHIHGYGAEKLNYAIGISTGIIDLPSV